MESIQHYFQKMFQYATDMFVSWLSYTLLFALLGLILGIVTVVIAGKKGYFKRPQTVWSVIAGLNYAYIPLVLLVFGGFFGSIYGTHTCADKFFMDTAKPLSAIGKPILDQVIAMTPSIQWSKYPGESLDNIVAAELEVKADSRVDKMLSTATGFVYKSVINHVVKETYIPTMGLQPWEVLQKIKNKPLPSNTFIGLYRTVQDQFDQYYRAQYVVLAWLFVPFLLLPIGEYLLFRFLARYPRIKAQGLGKPFPGAQTLAIPPLPALHFSKQADPLPFATPRPKPATDTPAQEPSVQQVPYVPPPASPAPKEFQTAAAQVSFGTVPSALIPPASSAITYVLGGALLQLFASLGSGWITVCVAIFGFVVFYSGLEKWKQGLDAPGQAAVKLLQAAAITGAVAAFVGLIPFLGILASLGFLGAFILELIGFVSLKSSNSIGVLGKSGANLLIAGMVLALLGAIFGMIPFIGSFIAGPIGLAALMLVFFGWIRVQEGMVSIADQAFQA